MTTETTREGRAAALPERDALGVTDASSSPHNHEVGPLSLRPARISRASRWLLILGLAVACVAPPTFDFVTDYRVFRTWRGMHALLDRFRGGQAADAESELARTSAWAGFCRDAQTVALPSFRGENNSVLFGNGGFLFFRDELRYVEGGSFLDADTLAARTMIPAIVAFRDELARRGVHLVLLPVPAKYSVYPDRLKRSYDLHRGPPVNRDRGRWVTSLREHGVDVIDVLPTLWAARSRDVAGAEPLFIPTDSHWTPRGLAIVADQVADHLRERVADAPRASWRTEPRVIKMQGDLVKMLALSDADFWYPRIEQHLQTVLLPESAGSDASPPEDQFPILVLGDSYADCFFKDEAGLSHQLMSRLGVRVRTVALNAGAINRVRERLAEQPGWLDGKRVVVWEFAERYLRDSDEWKQIDMRGANQ